MKFKKNTLDASLLYSFKLIKSFILSVINIFNPSQLIAYINIINFTEAFISKYNSKAEIQLKWQNPTVVVRDNPKFGSGVGTLCQNLNYNARETSISLIERCSYPKVFAPYPKGFAYFFYVNKSRNLVLPDCNQTVKDGKYWNCKPELRKLNK